MNIARRHRHGKAWDQASDYVGPLTLRQLWKEANFAVVVVTLACLLFWVGIAVWVAS